jgi:dienelactone hydrolase
MGRPHDMTAFRSFHYDRHGVNVIHPVFPLHGPRRLGRRSGDGVITVDPLSNVLGLSQAIWDIRRCILWAREQGATGIGVHGVSLGAYTAALLAGLSDDLDCVVAGIPPADLVSVLSRSMSHRARSSALEQGLLGDDARAVHTVVSPLAVTPRIPRDQLFIYAGLGDRMSTAAQAELLWRHWDRPEIYWFASSHIGQMFVPEVHRFARRAVYSSLLGPGADEAEPGHDESQGAA